MDIHLSSKELQSSTLFFEIVALVFSLPLIAVFPDPEFRLSASSVVVSGALFWGLLSVAASLGFWDMYYKYFYPQWMRRFALLEVLLYAGISLGMWWLAVHIPGPAVLWFALLGGVEGVAEHVIGVYHFHILEKVPWLRGLDVFPTIVFSFFEYIVYWSLVAWFGLLITRLHI